MIAQSITLLLALGIWGAGLHFAVRPVISSMPLGLALVTLQYFVDLYSLLSGREPPFGMKARETAEDVARAQARQALGDTP